MTYTLILSNSRNIVNTDIIDKFLSDMKRLTNNNEVRNWIDKKLKKYMLDEYKIVKPFKGKSKIDDPEWLKKAISDNQATEIKLSKRFINHVTDIVKYLEKLDPYIVCLALNGNAVLLCWEKPFEFCHRHLVAEWLNNNLNCGVREL